MVTDEAALRRPIGGQEAFSAQLDRVEELLRRRNITVQAIAATTAAYAGLISAFTLFSFADAPDAAFVPGPCHTGQFIAQPDTVEALAETYDLIRSAALSDRQTAELIRQIRETL